MREISVTNLILNGDVEASVDHWKPVTGDLAHVSFESGTHALKLTATEDAQDICFETAEGVTLIMSHKYYLRYRVALYGDISSPIKVNWPGTVDARVVPTANAWYYITKIIDGANMTSGVYPVQFMVGNVANAQYAYYDQMLMIDLTTDFGAGKEPDLAWCDENLPIYFDGTMVLPFWQSDVPVFTEASVVPSETTTGSTVKIACKIEIQAKLFEAESVYSGEIYSGEV